MRQIFISFTTSIISFSSLSSNLFADIQTEYPKLYKSLWPEFCIDHLLNESEACSEMITGNETSYEHYNQFKDLYYEYAIFWPQQFAITVDHGHVIDCEAYISYLPYQQRLCSYVFCSDCKKPVQKSIGIFNSEDDGDDLKMQHLCECAHVSVSIESKKYQIYEDKDWHACKRPTIPFAYFNQYTSKYSSFLKQHLQYSEQNQACKCYWSYISKTACQISNLVYDSMQHLLQKNCLSDLVDKHTDWILTDEFPLEDWPEIGKEHLLRALQNQFIFSFFYSNYHTSIIDLCTYVDTNSLTSSIELQRLYSVLASIRPLFLNLYSNCLNEHPHPKIYYERGMIYFHNGDLFASLSDMRAFTESANADELEELLTSDFYLQEGSSYAELGQYDQSIEALTKSISKDPENKEAYFERASIYFETGDFDRSIQDYLESDFRPTPIDLTDLSTIEFSKHLIFGIMRGSGEAVTDFIPSVLASANGLSHGIWAFACDPVNCSKEMVDSCKGMLEFLSSSSGIEMLETFIPEIKDFNNAQSSEEKAALLGFMIGKYGTEIFAPAGALKVYKNLRSANRLLTLQNLSKASKEATVVKDVAANWNKAHLESIDQFKKVESALKAYKGQFFTETTARKILHEAGFETFHKPKGLPDNFRVQLADKGGGMKYVHPDHTYESVRVMPGKPHSQNVNQQKPYITHHTKDGLAYDKYGNKVSQKSVESHIPLEEFVYRPDVT